MLFVVTGNAVLQVGFIPVFVDADRKTLNINALMIEACYYWKNKYNYACSDNGLINYTKEKGIGTGNLFSSILTQCSGFVFLSYNINDFSNLEYIGEVGIHIGIHQDLSRGECGYFLIKCELRDLGIKWLLILIILESLNSRTW